MPVKTGEERMPECSSQAIPGTSQEFNWHAYCIKHDPCQSYQCDTYATLMNKIEKYGISQKIILDNI